MIDHENTDNIICPYCGEEDIDSWEIQSSEEDYQCGSCDEKFNVEVEHSISYSTLKKECVEGNHDNPLFPDLFWIDDKLLKENWRYIESYDCKECSKTDYKYLSEEEFKQKHQTEYEIILKKHGLFVKNTLGEEK